VSDLGSAERVVDWLRDQQQRSPDSFGWSVPAMTNQVAPGISIGAHPDSSMGFGATFGLIRTNIIHDKLGSATSFAEFKDAVLRGFDENGIDSLAPYRNSGRR
jgi:hypothetical protein